MLEKMFSKLFQAAASGRKVLPDSGDLDILEVLYREGNKIENKIRKSLQKSGKDRPHSSVNGKLKRLSTLGYVRSAKEIDGHTYYDLEPLGLVVLFQYGRININQLITHMLKNQKKYFQILAKFEPNLIQALEKQPPWFVTQLTEDLWVIYYIKNRSELRKQTLKLALALAKGDTPISPIMQYEVEPLCVHRIEVEGKGICVKQKEKCLYRPREVAKCPILKQQMLKELEKHLLFNSDRA